MGKTNVRGPIMISAATALSVAVLLSGAAAAADTTEGYCLSYRAPADTSRQTLEAAADTLDHRLGAMGIAAAADADHDAGTIDVQLKLGPDDPGAATELAAGLGATGLLEFMPVPPELQGLVDEGPLPDGMQDIEPLFTGVEIDSAAVATDDWTGELVVDLQLKDTGSRLFDEYATDHYGEQFAIVLDGEALSAPTIQVTRFGGRAQIYGGVGGFTRGEAQALVAAVSSGAMPIELSLDDVRSCAVPADLSVQTPLALLARAGEKLEVPATQVATRLHDFGIDDFVITLHPETERITVTILSADPALVGPVERLLSPDWFGDGIDLAFTDDTLAEVLEALPDLPVALRWSSYVPAGATWQPEEGALIGDPSPSGVDVEAFIQRYDDVAAFQEGLAALTEHPDFVGGFGAEDGAMVLQFTRGNVPEGAIAELNDAGVDMSLFGATTLRGEEFDVTSEELEHIRDTLAGVLAEYGLGTDDFQIAIGSEVMSHGGPDDVESDVSTKQMLYAYIGLADPEAEDEIRAATEELLGEGAVELWFTPDLMWED